jgi:hypothetical protein
MYLKKFSGDQRRDPLRLQFPKQVRAVPFPAEDHREARHPWVGGHALFPLHRRRDVGLQPWQHLSAHGLHQTVIDSLMEIAARFAVQRIHPVVHRGAQVEPLAWHRVPRQLAQFTDGTDARQRHQRQQHHHAAQPIEAWRQGVFRAVA